MKSYSTLYKIEIYFEHKMQPIVEAGHFSEAMRSYSLHRFIGLICVLLVSSAVGADLQDRRPNILYIFTDDQSVRTVSCYPDAYPWVKTPNIDALAKAGVRFEKAYMAPYCVPSRITQLTGNLPHAARGDFNGKELTGSDLQQEIQEHPFWPQRLRESGYRTGIIGKWHLYSRPPAVGIDWDTAIHWNKKIDEDYYYNQKVSINGAPPVDLGGYSVDRHTDFAVDFIKGKSENDKPWYLWLCYSGVHMPIQPAARHQGALASVNDIPEPSTAKLPREGKPAYIRDLPEPSWKRVMESIKRYQECVMAVDENVGRLRKVLEETKQMDNTIIIFASDQGIAYGQHGLVHKKNAPYDAALCSPLIVSWPGHFAQGAVSPEPISGPDIVQTLLDITGVKPSSTMDGMSLVPLLKDPGLCLAREAMLMTNVQNDFGQSIPLGVAKSERFISKGGKGEKAMRDWAMIRSGDYKYVAYVGEAKEEELYNIKEDPEELHNLAAERDYSDEVSIMRLKASQELRRTQSGFDGGHYIDFFPLLRNLTH